MPAKTSARCDGFAQTGAYAFGVNWLWSELMLAVPAVLIRLRPRRINAGSSLRRIEP